MVPLLGNHDQLLLHNRASRSEIDGIPLIDPDNGLERFSSKHFDFLSACRMFHGNETHIFVHANCDADAPLEEQDPYRLICIDTYCHGGGWLTAFDSCTGHIWQVDRNGHERNNVT